MSNQAKVEDSEVFTLFRVAMLKFAQAASTSLSSADSQISRTHSWLESEQLSYWQLQLRKRAEAVAKARDAVRQKKLYKDSSGKMRDAIEEEKALAQCIAAAEHAQQRMDSVRKWLPRLEKASDLYRSGASRLSRNLEGDIPNAIAMLERLAVSLEQYVQIEAPAGGAEFAASAGSADPMSRGGTEGQEPAPPAIAPSTPPPAAESPPPAPKEARDVAQ